MQSNLFEACDCGKADCKICGTEEQPMLPGMPAADKEPEQLALIDVGEWWDDAWQGMPDYATENQEPFRTILVHFADRDAVKKFSELMGQPITKDTQWLWFPKADRMKTSHLKWVDAE